MAALGDMSGRARERGPLRVAVFLGGRSTEHEISLLSGRNVLRALRPGRHLVKPVLLARDGSWSVPSAWVPPAEGLARLASPPPPDPGPARLLSDPPDIAFLALHGRHGEDGEIQGFLQTAGIPYTGSGVAASALAMDKELTRIVLEGRGIAVPPGRVVRREEDLEAAARDALALAGPHSVVKVHDGGSSLGVEIVPDAAALLPALARALGQSPKVLVERYIAGREMTCGVLGNAERGGLRALPVTEIVPRPGRFFDYHSKYTPGACEEVTPAPLDRETARTVQETALRAHAALGCGGASRTDFRLGPEGVYVLEVNTLPGLTSRSLVPQAAEAAGIAFPDLVDLLIELGRERAGRAGGAEAAA